MIEIGRRDRIDLPELGYSNVKVKIDTGAFSNALHCTNIELTHQNGKEVLSFNVFDSAYPGYKNKKLCFDVYTDKLVKNSSGDTERRFTIETPVIYFGKTFLAEFSLTDRRVMKYPILLGRKFLSKKFLVNVDLKDVSYNQKINK